VRDVRKTILPLLAVVFVLGPQTGVSESEPSGSLQLVKDVRPGPIGSSIADVVETDGDLYFVADDGTHRLELWRSDGTPDGTTLVKDVWPGPEGSQEAWYPYRTESWLDGGRRHAVLRGTVARVGDGAPRRPECTITGTDGADRLVGTDGPDVICARGGDDEVRARGGDDVIFLGPGRDAFSAGAGDDRVFAGRGDDYYGDGGRGDDRVFLQGGDDLVEDYMGADLLSGGSGSDWLCNGDGKGNDRLIGGPGRDHAAADKGDTVLSVEVEGPCFY
jgi:ELWxxDGT repeat protein